MNFPRFFIDRPIFAIVLSVLLLIAGLLALLRLPLSEYPAVAPPTVTVVAAYPGASPDVIAETVASPIEQAVNEGAPEVFAWRMTLGLVVTLVWLYLEILRFLAILNSNN